MWRLLFELYLMLILIEVTNTPETDAPSTLGKRDTEMSTTFSFHLYSHLTY